MLMKVQRRFTVGILFAILVFTTGLFVSCNKTAEDTNKPVIIESFNFFVNGDPATPAGTLQIEPGSVLNIEVVFTDPDAGQTPDPGWYSFTWVVERLGTGVSPFNPNEYFITYTENPCIWTGPEVTGFYRFTVEVRDRYGTPSQESIVAEVNANKHPIINGLSISNNQPFVNEEITVSVDADDPDGNLPLEYDWQADGGYFTLETENEAHWLSPTPGDFKITVIITDQANGSVSRTLPLIVQANHEPVIQGWDLDPGNSVTYNALVSVTLTVTDEDNDPLEYNWQADYGTFNAVNQNTATWRAPGETVSAKITVTVEDNKGGSDVVEIIINVSE